MFGNFFSICGQKLFYDLNRIVFGRKSLFLVLWFILYGFCGFFVEVMFIVIWYFVDFVKYCYGWKFYGCIFVWSFFIYVILFFVVERMFLFLNDKISLVIRGFLYVVWIYIWEFLIGFILRQFNVCFWDYIGYIYFNIMGLIILDYVFLWFIGFLLFEIVVI